MLIRVHPWPESYTALSIPPPSSDPCQRLLDLCLSGDPLPGELGNSPLLNDALRIDDGRAFLSRVIEPLCDRFEPRLSAIYQQLMTQAIALTMPSLSPRVRPSTKIPELPATAGKVYVLSRITLGADVAVTSVLMDAAKQRFPDATIQFVGPHKNYELFSAERRVKHFPAPYARSGSLEDRLTASAQLWFPLVMQSDGIVIDPDSRLTQLGLIQVCPSERYFFFDSRAYSGEEDGQDDTARLPDLAAQWAEQVLGVSGAKPYIATPPITAQLPDITVSLGVGGNPEKWPGAAFERDLLTLLASTGKIVRVDKGGDKEEAARVMESVIAIRKSNLQSTEGSFASFAAEIARSKLYVGYDSAGGHVASACGVPVISIAQGFATPRMAARWRPNGIIVRGNPEEMLSKVESALEMLGFVRGS